VKPLAFSDDAKDMLMWSMYVRLEPAIALHKSFYLLGLFGYENWLAKDAWMMRFIDPKRPNSLDNGRIINPTTLTYLNSSGGIGKDAYREDITPRNFVKVPINYVDMAYGLGFDWDMLERVGLHGRVKYITHEDKGLNEYYDNQDRNDWGTWVVSLEIKTWF